MYNIYKRECVKNGLEQLLQRYESVIKRFESQIPLLLHYKTNAMKTLKILLIVLPIAVLASCMCGGQKPEAGASGTIAEMTATER